MSNEKTEIINIPKEDYEELIHRLHEAEQVMLKMKTEEKNIFESIKNLKPKKVTLEF